MNVTERRETILKNVITTTVLLMGLFCICLASCKSPTEPEEPEIIEIIILEVSGKVTDAITDQPIFGVSVELVVTGTAINWSDIDVNYPGTNYKGGGRTNNAGQYSVKCQLIKNRAYFYWVDFGNVITVVGDILIPKAICYEV